MSSHDADALVTDEIGGSPPAVEWLFIDDSTPGTDLHRWLESTLPMCAWSSHVVVAGSAAAAPALAAVETHLSDEPLAIVHLHVVCPGDETRTAIDALMRAAERFQREAYRERTGSRLVPLPILEPTGNDDPRPLLDRARALAGRLAKPSLLLASAPDAETAVEAAEIGLRIYLAEDGGQAALSALTSAHVLDSALERVETLDALLQPCRPHTVLHRGMTYACARQWRRQLPLAGLDVVAWAPNEALCAACLADTAAASTASLRANLRSAEGRELGLRLSAALVDRSLPGPASAVAETAAELSDSGDDRAAALIQTALCRLAAGRLAEADAALVEAGRCGAAAGLIAYHRAHVQVAWRDDIEALDRFAEALEHGVEAVSPDDLHLEMALSHIRLEEWSDARSHLQLAGGPSPAVAFNLGVCDVNEGRAAAALIHFDTAIELGPSADDLGRVRFFRGYCLKQLERYDEAVEDLARSIELETAEAEHHNLMGFCLFKLERYEEAVASFERAVSLDPSSAIDWANIGVNLERLGGLDRAADMYRKALGLDPSIGFASEGLARLTGKR